MCGNLPQSYACSPLHFSGEVWVGVSPLTSSGGVDYGLRCPLIKHQLSSCTIVSVCVCVWGGGGGGGEVL